MPKTTRPRGRPATGAERRSISLPVEVWDKIEAAADGRPLSVEVGRLVENGFQLREMQDLGIIGGSVGPQQPFSKICKVK